MKVVIAVDKFKHSLTAFEVCQAVERGLRKASTAFQVMAMPLADGGDGLAEVLAYYQPFQKRFATVYNPLWQFIRASYLFAGNEGLAFVEMAQASGLHLLKPADYNCAITTSYGTGQLIKDALQNGAEKIIIGIGGSATNDCGIGTAAALGYRFLDAGGKEVEPVGKCLSTIQRIDASVKRTLEKTRFTVASDVTNYLVGDEGATRIYGPQKGATPKQVEELEAGMQHFVDVVKKELGIDMTTIKSGGAAGGMGAGCVAFLSAAICSGAELSFEYSHAEERIAAADVVITGEGKIDSQTWNGKLVHAVSKICGRYSKPLLAVCGTLESDEESLKRAGIKAVFPIVNKERSLEDAMQNALSLLVETAYEAGCYLKTQA